MPEKIILILTFFVGCLEFGQALTCYQCNSTKDADCLENFQYYGDNSLKPMLCPVDKSRYCIKTTGVFGSVVGVTRFCSSMDMGNQCQYLPFIDHDRTYRGCIYTCVGDQCNLSRPNANLNLFNLVFILTSWILMYHFTNP